jgi:hypothetical protein
MNTEINQAENEAEYQAIVELFGAKKQEGHQCKSVEGVKCPFCVQVLISHYTHDFHRCRCGYTFVDGGRSYLRFGYGFGFSLDDMPEWARLHEQLIGVPETVEIRINEHGVIG